MDNFLTIIHKIIMHGDMPCVTHKTCRFALHETITHVDKHYMKQKCINIRYCFMQGISIVLMFHVSIFTCTIVSCLMCYSGCRRAR